MQLVLGVQGIPASEVELLRSILRLSSNLRFPWKVSDGAACDLLLVDGHARPDGRDATEVVPVLPRPAAGAEAAGHEPGAVLARPIYAEEVVELLNGVARRAAARPAGGLAALARLKRWPSHQTLALHASHIRLATTLTRGALSSAELSRRTGVAAPDCARFLELLDAEGALAWQTAETPGGAEAASPSRPAPLAAPAPTGLLSRIRRRLGLA